MGKMSRSERLERQLETTVARVSTALRKLASAMSGQFGYDCAMHATIGRSLLADLGFDARRVVGYAAWRLGAGAGDVISHVPSEQGYKPQRKEGRVYHAWLQYRGLVIDFTTYQFYLKAQILDAFDGGHTSVNWRTDFLLLPTYRIQRFTDVRQAKRTGLAYYEARRS